MLLMRKPDGRCWGHQAGAESHEGERGSDSQGGGSGSKGVGLRPPLCLRLVSRVALGALIPFTDAFPRLYNGDSDAPASEGGWEARR